MDNKERNYKSEMEDGKDTVQYIPFFTFFQTKTDQLIERRLLSLGTVLNLQFLKYLGAVVGPEDNTKDGVL